MKLAALLDVFNTLAPETLAEDWDQVGLHLGDPEWDIRKALLCIDLTEAVLAEAVAQKANLIVAYHPPIFQPVGRLTTQTWKTRILLECARQGIALYSPHTALDAATEGINHWLASAFDAESSEPIIPTVMPGEYKVVTFVPHEAVDKVRTALSEAGAGRIGHYSQCSFNTPGEGTFLGDATTHPAVGQAGRLEKAQEMRIEMVVPGKALRRVAEALYQAHPYEEPAFDIYRTEPNPLIMNGSGTGQGRLCMLRKPVSMKTVIARLKKHLSIRHLKVAQPDNAGPVQRIALCAGAGVSVVKLAKADLWITGEMRHHDLLDANQKGISVILAGHTHTERPYLPVYRDRLAAQTTKNVQWMISNADVNLWEIA